MPDPEKRSEDPAPAQEPTSTRKLGFLERQRRRGDLRRQLAVREQLLLELGAIVYELHRQGQRAPELLQARAAELDEVDGEVRAMQAALDANDPAAWPAPAWDEHEAGAWDANGGEWEPAGDEDDRWDDAAAAGGDRGGAPSDDDETGEWRPEDEWVDDDWDESDEDLGETQEWSAEDVADAVGSSNGTGEETADETTDEERT